MNEKIIGEALKNVAEISPSDVHHEPFAQEPPWEPIFNWFGVQLLACAYATVITGIIIFLLKAGK